MLTMCFGDAVSVVELYAKECTCVLIPALSSIASLDHLLFSTWLFTDRLGLLC
jgi:hypothetical protein